MERKPSLKIIHKVTIAYILMIILPITIVASTAYYQFYEREKSSILRTQLNILNQTEEKLDYTFNVSDSLSKTIAKNTRLKNYLSSGGAETYYSENEFYEFISPLFEYSITHQMIKYHSTTVFIHDASVKEMGHTFIHDTTLRKQQWYNDFVSSESQTLWLTPHAKKSLGGTDNDDRKVYSYCRKLNSSSGEYVGLLVINIYEDDFYKSFTGLYPHPTEFHFINLKSEEIYTSLSSSSFKIYDIKEIELTQLPYSNISDNRFYTYTYIEDMDLYLAVSSLMQSQFFLNPQLMAALIISAVCLILVIVFFYRYISSIFSIINKKITAVNNIIQNNFEERLRIKRNDEIGAISKSFNILLDKINALVKDVVAKETAQKDAKLKALQYQINPHFIYNTIEIFSNKTELSGEYETSDALASFGKMLRYNLKNDTIFSTIEEEIQHVRSFIKIEKLKYGDNLTCNINYSKELSSVKIIKFIMQPIVENCFTHGFNNTSDNMIIDINILAVDNTLEFSVADNGKGIDPDYCRVLNEVFRTSNYKHPEFKNAENQEGIGLMNINERLKLFYDTRCSITISQIHGFTLVSFCIPMIAD